MPFLFSVMEQHPYIVLSRNPVKIFVSVLIAMTVDEGLREMTVHPLGCRK